MSALLDSLLTPQQRAQAAAVDAAMLAMTNAQAAHPRLAMQRALARTVADATQPRDVSQRPCFDTDFGAFNGHPADPRYLAREEVGNMLEAINCAERALQMARDALEGIGCSVDTLTARSLFNEARDFLAVPQ